MSVGAVTDDEIERLLARIDEIDRISDDEWAASLNERKRKELEFHDRDRDAGLIAESAATDTFEKFYGNIKYYSTTQRSHDYLRDWIAREASGKVFLDYACGNGANALWAARHGAKLSLGFDISPVSVRNATAIAASATAIGPLRYFQADAENTMLPDESIDTVICSGMLHHLDLSYALPELRRILKPGGRILALEALDYNPAIKLYRRMTPAMRTDWEKAHILSLKDVRFAARFFEIEDVTYWHITGYIGGRFPRVLPVVDRLDRALERIPLVQRLSWMFSFVMRRPIDPSDPARRL
jgi:ubiquinone/menaquinone biosynthesis C-methylase UbiE